jgi:hypothetical protein
MTTKLIDLKDHPELKIAHDFVSKIPRAVIAGGVARDILLNGALSDESDIDIFIGCPEDKISMATLLLEIFNFCNDLNIKPRIVDYYSELCGVRIKAGKLDISMVGHMPNGIEDIISKFDMVSSQAWLVPIPDGFQVCCSDLFQQLHDRSVLGYYPELCMQPSKHVDHIAQRFPGHILLALRVPPDPDLPF